MKSPAQPQRPSPESGGPRRTRSQRSVPELEALLRSDPELAPRFSHWERVAARAENSRPLPESLDPRLRALLESRGQTRLYEHQARAIELALEGRDVLVATPTDSGKTLCYVAPILQRLLETRGDARAIALFPTKALSQDQSAGLNALIAALGEPWHSFTYDGDTPPSVRRTLRDDGHIVLTNPWMLHAGILPNHAKWSELFANLRTIVIDEVHTLSGVFGSSVANVLRRLLRIAEHYGSRPQFVLCSATLRDAAAHAKRLTGRDVAVVDEDGSPSGERVFGVYNPPMLDPVAGLRANALEEARRLATHLCGPSRQVIFFCQRRTSVEVLTRYLKESAQELGLEPDEIRGYRGGYLPLHRREIEEGLRAGSVKVVVSTNALELGIDIGRLDVAVLVGYPGSQASFWQRAGRVGRRGQPSMTVLIARSDPIDQYLSTNPDYLFRAPRERLGLDPDNLVILSEQVKCASFELPFRDEELERKGFGGAPHLADILDYLAGQSNLLLRRGDTWHWMADAYPAQDVPLSSGGPDNVLVLDVVTKKAIGEIDREGSLTTVHEGAIYQVQGETWKVERFDYENRRAYVRAVESDYFTEAEVDTTLKVLRLERHARRERAAGGEDYGLYAGEVHVTTVATQYKKIRFYTRENVGTETIHLPPEELDTQAFVLTISSETAEELGLSGSERGAAWRSVGSLLRRVAPLFLRCQPNDLGLSTEVRSTHFRRPAIVLYDRVQGGVGLAEVLFEAHRDVLLAALDVVRGCECKYGCPGCVGPRAEAGELGKPAALRLLQHLSSGALARPAPVPEGEE
ncbi:MAG: DEAD/DEAH box helicase [Planctomycetota bacterium]|nr:DEAD/DEAH box helicase [Planctomycetota bacterium]